MSSVLIKGMKMPKTCEECDFCHWSNLYQTGRCDRCDDEPVCADFGTDYKRTRARFCPLVEVPTPHGRLIDERVAEQYIGDHMMGLVGRGGRSDWQRVHDGLADTPTVIEAEGKEHDER